ncbi:MAG: electron transporter RnfD, partial [Lachnospiraceae bacterium]|nr:electron transporter RnfD [Lachnospiraceae bacterium]
EDPIHNGEYSNSWYSYAWITARKLNAQIHDIAQGGIALMDKSGWFCEPKAVGMETVWNKVHYNPMLGAVTQWDLSQYIPQVVIVAIGQNDSHPQDYIAQDCDGKQASVWRQHYKGFLKKLRTAYPNAVVICCTTLLKHDASWDRAIGQAVREMSDEKITQYLFKRNGTATFGHLRIPEAQEMADELAAYIETLDIPDWE